MDSFELNKIAGAVLGVMLLILGLNALAGAIYHTEKPEKAGYVIEVAAASDTSGGESIAKPAYEPSIDLIASADIAAGEKAAKNALLAIPLMTGAKIRLAPIYGTLSTRPLAGLMVSNIRPLWWNLGTAMSGATSIWTAFSQNQRNILRALQWVLQASKSLATGRQ